MSIEAVKPGPAMSNEAVKLSFVVPCFNEQGNVCRFYEEFKLTFDRTDFSCEVIFIDDGSKDDTFREIKQIVLEEQDPRFTVKGILFSRNFGKESGIYTGLEEATGDIIGIIDADLQQPPSVALEMVEILIDDPDLDCVAAYQENRREAGVLKKLKEVYYRVFSSASGMDTIQDASDFRVFRRVVAQALLDMPERLRFFKGMSSWVGFNMEAFPYTPRKRVRGESKWSTKKLFSYGIGGMISFSVAPLRLATLLGLLSFLCALIYIVAIIAKVILNGIDVPGYATTMSVTLLLGGIQLLCLGILGEYVARIYIEQKQRPISVIKEKIDSTGFNH